MPKMLDMGAGYSAPNQAATRPADPGARAGADLFIAFLSSFGPGGPPSSRNAARSLHRSGSPCGSLRDQVLASSNLPSVAIAGVGVVAWLRRGLVWARNWAAGA
ncbi:hypothetical protein OHR68_24650 [Spirillospora sp. NBC_00431]